MAYTYTQLTKAYAAVHGYEPTGEAASQLLLMTNASYTDAQRMAYILNSADQSTAVAVLSYQFFTGKAPSAEGLDYLLKSGEKNLNSETYAKFNLENRFMNFATNLALEGEAKAAFEANYGSMTYAQYVASIYETIIGKTQATAAGLNAEQTIADIIARQDLILLSARNNGVIGPNATQAEIDLALKAATAAYLLAEGIKADVGIYAGATNNFMIGVATGKAVYGTDITKTYAPTTDSGSSGNGQTVNNPPPIEDLPGLPPAQPEPTGPTNRTFTLTTGTDKFTGGAGDDSFIGTDLTFNNSDVLDGGAGHDTLTLTATGYANNAFSPNATATGIETLVVTSDGGVNLYNPDYAGLTKLTATAGWGATNITSTSDVETTLTVTGQADATIGVYGGSDVTVTSTGATTGSITVGTTSNFATPITGDIVISRETAGAVTAGTIAVIGGKTVSITQTATNAVGTTQVNGAVQVDGTDLTTEVTIKAAKAATADGATAGITASAVQIYDINRVSATLAGTIAKVDVDSYTTLSVITNALTDLTLANGSGDVLIGNSGLTTPTNKTLALKVSGLTGGTLDDAEIYETLNVTTGAAASTLANITFGGLKTLNVAGDSRLTLTSTAGLTALETVKVSGAAGLTANLSGATVTSVDASGTTGANTLTIDATQTAFDGGSGVDNITLSATPAAQAITLGGGDDRIDVTAVTDLLGTIAGGAGTDTLVMTAAQANAISGQTFATGFEILELTNANAQTIDLSMLGNGLTTVRTQGGNGLTLNKIAAGSTLELTGAGTAYTLANSLLTGSADTVKVKLTDGSGAGVNFASTGVTASTFEVVNITNTDTQSTPTGSFLNALTWLGNNVKTITISGNAGLALTTTSQELLTIDASGITQGGFTWTAGGVWNSPTVKGSATGTNTVNLANFSNGFTYVGGTGSDNITFGAGRNKLDLVSGVDHVTVTGAPRFGDTQYSEITHFGIDDQLTLSLSGASVTSLTHLTGRTTVAEYLAAAVQLNDATKLQWFTVGADTYVVQDRGAGNTFQNEVDVMIKLVGVGSLSEPGWEVANGTLSFVAPG